jgi:5,10-methylenetetrahydromethanopterin reductase
MRISMNIGGDVLSAPVAPAELVEQAVVAEAAGFPAAWTTHFTRGTDSLAAIAVAGSRTSRIELGIGIVPTYPRHPFTLAQEAATVQSLCGGRLTLGVGVSHKPIMEKMLGLEFTSPAAHMRAYLQVLGPLLTDGSVTHHGRFFNVDCGFNVVGTSPVSIVVGALGPRMIEVAGEFSDGTVTWLAGSRGIGEYMAPGLAKAAMAAGRGKPRIIVGLPVAVCDEVEAGRAAVLETFARYGGLDNYRQQFEREGVESAADLAIYGPEDVVLARLNSLRDAGATEFWGVPFAVGADPAASVARTTAFLASLAPEL